MTPRAIAVVLGLAVGLALLKAQTPPASPQQTFRVENIDQLDAAIRHILGDRARREDLRRRGLARARLFSWDEAARRLVAVFDRRDTPGR